MNTPRINPNDPKWTAYVLGELDEADRASVERLLEASAEARALVNELKMSASALDDALTSESPELLTAAQRAAVRDAADAGRARWFAHVQPQLRTRWSLGPWRGCRSGHRRRGRANAAGTPGDGRARGRGRDCGAQL